MNAVLSFIWGIGLLCLLVFLLPFGTEFTEKFGLSLCKLSVTIIGCLGIFVVFLVEKILVLTNIINWKSENNTKEPFKSQSELYFLICGCVLFIGLLLVVWQVNVWSKKNDKIRSRVRKVESQITKLSDEIWDSERKKA